MKTAISAKDILSFCNKLIALLCCIDNAGLSGMLYFFTDKKMLLVLDDSPQFNDRDFSMDLGAGLLSNLDDSVVHEATGQERINNINELIFRCFLEDAKPEKSWTKEIIFCLDRKEDLAKTVEMLLFHDCFKISGAVLEEKEYKYLIRAEEPPLYVVLYCRDNVPCRVFYRALGNYFSPWGISYPLLREDLLLKTGNHITLLFEQGNHIYFENSLEDIYSLVIPEFCGKKTEATENTEELKIRINLQLKTADEVQNQLLPKEEIWLIPKNYIERFSRDIYKPESHLNELEGYYLKLKDKAYLLLWNCSICESWELSLSSLTSPAVKAFYRVPYISKKLYVPKGKIFTPHLQEETMEKLFGLSDDHFTLIIPEDDQGFYYIHFPGKRFKSVRKAYVDYISDIREAAVLDNSDFLYDFGTPIVYNKPSKDNPSQHKKKDKKKKDKGTRIKPSKPSAPKENRTNNIIRNILKRFIQNKPENSEAPDTNGPSNDKNGKISIETGCTKKDLLGMASEMFGRYSELTLKDWSEFYDMAKISEYYYRRDKTIAMTNILFNYDSNIEFVLGGLGISPGQFSLNGHNKILDEVFQDDWREKEEGEIIFKLYALAGRFPDIEPEHKYKGYLNELSGKIYACNNLKLIWMLTRIHSSIMKDESVIKEGKNKLQSLMNMLYNPRIIGELIPETIRIVITNRFLSENEEALGKLSRSLPESAKPWFSLLKFLYLEMHPVFVPSETDLQSIGENIQDEEQMKFYNFLNDIISVCNRSHSLHYGKDCCSGCDIKSHSNIPEFILRCIKEEEEYHRMLGRLSDDTSLVEYYLQELKLPEPKAPFFLCLSRCILYLVQSDNKHLDLVRSKIENWSHTENIDHYRGILYLLMGNKMDKAGRYANDRLMKIETSSPDNGHTGLLIFWLNLADLVKTKIEHDKTTEFYNKLFMSAPAIIDHNFMRILYSIISIHFRSIEDDWDEIARILNHERKIIRENVNKDINKQVIYK